MLVSVLGTTRLDSSRGWSIWPSEVVHFMFRKNFCREPIFFSVCFWYTESAQYKPQSAKLNSFIRLGSSLILAMAVAAKNWEPSQHLISRHTPSWYIWREHTRTWCKCAQKYSLGLCGVIVFCHLSTKCEGGYVLRSSFPSPNR